MKKLIITSLIATTLVFGCNSQTEVKEVKQVNNTPAVSSVNNKPRQLTKQLFLNEIMDYEKNPDKWIYKGEIPGVVDFYADWCRPCRITSPILEELAIEYAGKINFFKVNIDSEQELAGIFGVQSIPAFLFMPKSGNPTMSAGIASTVEETKAMFKKQLDQLLVEK